MQQFLIQYCLEQYLKFQLFSFKTNVYRTYCFLENSYFCKHLEIRRNRSLQKQSFSLKTNSYFSNQFLQRWF